MKRIFPITGFCLLLAGLGGCSSCAERERTLASLIPADSPGALIFPDLAQSVKDVRALMDKFSVGPLATFINQGHLEISRILGFDPLKLEDLRKLGLAPERGLAVVPAGDQPVLIVGVSNAKAFEAEIAARMKQLAAAEHISTSSHEGFAVTTVATRIGDQTSPQLLYGLVGPYALLAWAPVDPQQLARMASLKPEQSLQGADWYRSLQAKAPGAADLLLVVNATRTEALGPDAHQVGQYLRDGLMLALAFDSSGVDAQLFLGLKAETAARLNGLTSGVVDAHLQRYLPANTVLAFKARANVGKLLDELFGLDPDFAREYQQAMQAGQQATGADLEQASVKNLTGNLAFGLSLGKPDQINALFRRLAQPSAEQPQAPTALPAAFQVFYWAQIRDAAAWVQVLDNLLPLASERSQVQVDKSKVGSLQVIKLQGGGLDTAVFLLQANDLVGGCLGTGCEQTAADLVAGKRQSLATAFSPGAKPLFDEPSLAVGYLNCALVLEALSGLDAGAMGEGGLFAKMVLDLALTAVRNLKELTGVVRFTPEGVALSSRLDIQ